MSKSTGNFLTLKDAVDKFGADATRVAMADAGDGTEDANFDETVANSNILRLFTLKEWIEEILKDQTLRSGSTDGFLDKLFENEMNDLVHQAHEHYSRTDFKLALKSALYDFTSARDFYREATLASGIGMHKDLIRRYVELQALLLTPIVPHWSDYMWQEVLHKDHTVQNALWPTVPTSSPSLTNAREYVRSTTSAITSAEAAQLKKKTKGKSIIYDPKQPKKLTIFAAKSFPSWQQKYIDLLQESFGKTRVSDDNKVDSKAQEQELAQRVGKMGEAKKAMPFVQGLRRRLAQGEKPEVVFDRKLAFDEGNVLEEMVQGLKKTTGCKVIEVVMVDEGGKSGDVLVAEDGGKGGRKEDLPQGAESAVPGTPSFYFENIVA